MLCRLPSGWVPLLCWWLIAGRWHAAQQLWSKATLSLTQVRSHNHSFGLLLLLGSCTSERYAHMCRPDPMHTRQTCCLSCHGSLTLCRPYPPCTRPLVPIPCAELQLAGVLLNKVGGAAHGVWLAEALAAAWAQQRLQRQVHVLGCIPKVSAPPAAAVPADSVPQAHAAQHPARAALPHQHGCCRHKHSCPGASTWAGAATTWQPVSCANQQPLQRF